jgi:hypothetical protein
VSSRFYVSYGENDRSLSFIGSQAVPARLYCNCRLRDRKKRWEFKKGNELCCSYASEETSWIGFTELGWNLKLGFIRAEVRR